MNLFFQNLFESEDLNGQSTQLVIFFAKNMHSKIYTKNLIQYQHEYLELQMNFRDINRINFHMNLKAEEQILIRDIFDATVDPNDHSRTYLSDFAGIITSLGDDASLLVHNSHFDSILFEKLRVPDTNILDCLQDCWNRAQLAKGKAWNSSEQAQAFIQYSIDIIKNFIVLSLENPQLFPDQREIDPKASQASSKTTQIAMKVLTHIQQRGYNQEMVRVIADSCGRTFYDELLQVLLTRQRFQTILDSKALVYLSLLVQLLGQNDIRQSFIRLKDGNGLIDFSPFGLFARLSVLGQRSEGYHQQNEAIVKFQQRIISEFGGQRLRMEKIKFYTTLQNEYYNKLTEAYKMLLKKGTQKEFLEWNYKLLLSNIGRMKLASRLYNADNSKLSHDGILLNAYTVFLNLCKVITSREDQKYKSIDPSYFRDHEKAALMKYDPINTTPAKIGSQRKEFGTITQFFFLCIQFLHVGVCGAMQNFSEFNQLKKKFDQDIAQLPKNHPMYKKVQYQIEKIQSKVIRYFVLLLNDDATIHSTIKLLDLLLDLLPQWLGFGFNPNGAIIKLNNSDLIYSLPELLLTIVCKYHSTNFSYKQGYLTTIGANHVEKVLNLVCFLLSEQDVVSNPYVAASYVELVFLLLHDNKAGIMHEIFKNSNIAIKNLTIGLIRFYCNIAITGRSNQFYEKFKYRYYANKIFTSLWHYEPYRQDLKQYFQTPLFQRFLNMVMTDTTYCFDETNENYEKFKDLEQKKAQGPLSAEDLKNQQMVERIIGSTLSQSTSNLKLLRNLSAWSPETFLTQADRSTAVPLLNNILKTFVDPGSFASNRQLVAKFKFDRGSALSDLVQIFANVNINDLLSNEIVKDGRNYKKEYFSQALQKASNEHYTSVDILEKFQDLISKLATAENEEQDDEEIFGEIPDKYLCGLMSTLMKDPVMLPSSKNVVDRIAIHRALLSTEQDPFNRQPLKENEVIPLKQLKEEIQVWKKKRLEELKKGGKAVKYGKIAQTKKQESEDFLNNNRPIIEEE